METNSNDPASFPESFSNNPFASPAIVDTSNDQVGPGYISDLSALQTYATAWKMILAQFGVLLAIVVLDFLVRIPYDNTTDLFEAAGVEIPIGLWALIQVYGFLIVAPITMSASWAFLRAARGENPQVGDMFAVFSRNYLQAVLASFIKTLAVIAGVILLIIPGLILACRLAFVEYLIVDRKMSVWNAMRTSWEMTAGHGWTIFVMFWLTIPIVLVGLLTFCVGVFVSAMLITAAFAVLYHSIEVREWGRGVETPPVQPTKEVPHEGLS